MQQIRLKRFGKILVSRPAGLEAFNALRSSLDVNQPIEIDFEGVLTVTPTWFDEFLTNLADYVPASIELRPTTNASVQAILPVLAEARNDRVSDIIKAALADSHPSKPVAVTDISHHIKKGTKPLRDVDTYYQANRHKR